MNVGFEAMTVKEALQYCREHEHEFKADCHAAGEDGERQFDCLVMILESGAISPSELPDYGMDYTRNPVNTYTVQPCDIRVGDTMLFVVKAVVLRRSTTGKLRYRLYRCQWEGEDVPQGSRILREEELCAELFPSLAAVAKPDEG